MFSPFLSYISMAVTALHTEARELHSTTHKGMVACIEAAMNRPCAQDVDLTAKDGTKLHAWYLHPMGWGKATRRQRPTILFFQENAGNMTFRLPFLKLLARYLDCSIFAPRCALQACSFHHHAIIIAKPLHNMHTLEGRRCATHSGLQAEMPAFENPSIAVLQKVSDFAQLGDFAAAVPRGHLHVQQ